MSDSAREKIRVVQEFMKAIESVGGEVPKGLKRAVDRYLLAAEMGLDAGEAAEEVSRELAVVYHNAYKVCEASDRDGTDDYWVCRAKVDRVWQARNTQKVLDWNDDTSWVSKVWAKWKNRLAKVLESKAKSAAKKSLP